MLKRCVSRSWLIIDRQFDHVQMGGASSSSLALWLQSSTGKMQRCICICTWAFSICIHVSLKKICVCLKRTESAPVIKASALFSDNLRWKPDRRPLLQLLFFFSTNRPFCQRLLGFHLRSTNIFSRQDNLSVLVVLFSQSHLATLPIITHLPRPASSQQVLVKRF